eukprot:6380380-Pyramimonas_sp.AAC.1
MQERGERGETKSSSVAIHRPGRSLGQDSGGQTVRRTWEPDSINPAGNRVSAPVGTPPPAHPRLERVQGHPRRGDDE